MFPVLVPLYLVVTRYLVEYFPKRIQVAVALSTAVVFVAGDLPWFLRQPLPESWLSGLG